MDAVDKVLFGFELSDTVIEVSRVKLAGQVIVLHDTPTYRGSIRCQTVHIKRYGLKLKRLCGAWEPCSNNVPHKI